MFKSFERASLEVFYNDGSEKLRKQSYPNLKEGIGEAELIELSEAFADLAEFPVEEVVVVEHNRFVVI